MQKILLSAVAILAFGSLASAADLPRKGPVAAPVVRPACAQFGGFYIGGNAGWGFYDHTFNDRDGLGPFLDTGLPSSISGTDGAFNGGVQAGYNWQRGCTVFGVEADWSWAGNKVFETQLDGDQALGGTARLCHSREPVALVRNCPYARRSRDGRSVALRDGRPRLCKVRSHVVVL